ncbi:MAG: hypothetical protein U0326_19240 [Polyangiales bacterium]
MTLEENGYLSIAKPAQIDPGWIAFWLGNNTALPADAAVWTDPNDLTTENWYLNTTLSSIAQSSVQTVKKIFSNYDDYTPPGSLVKHAHTITTPGNPGFVTGLSKYFVIKNASNAVVAVIGQNQSNNPWVEHWWLDQGWVNLASTNGTTITLTAEAQSTASTKYSGLSGITYKKHTFSP